MARTSLLQYTPSQRVPPSHSMSTVGTEPEVKRQAQHGKTPPGDAAGHNERSSSMSGKIDIGKGRIEEAAGTLTGNDKLRNKGKTDQAVGRVKQTATKAIDKVAKLVRE